MKTNKADKFFSMYIRLRDSIDGVIGKCRTCGRIKLIKEMDCAHFIKRQFAPRYNEMNCVLCCKHCNNFLQGNDVEFRKYLVSIYGEDKVLMLEAEKYKLAKRGKFELEIIAKYYKEQAEKLAKEKGVELW